MRVHHMAEGYEAVFGIWNKFTALNVPAKPKIFKILPILLSCAQILLLNFMSLTVKNNRWFWTKILLPLSILMINTNKARWHHMEQVDTFEHTVTAWGRTSNKGYCTVCLCWHYCRKEKRSCLSCSLCKRKTTECQRSVSYVSVTKTTEDGEKGGSRAAHTPVKSNNR